MQIKLRLLELSGAPRVVLQRQGPEAQSLIVRSLARLMERTLEQEEGNGELRDDGENQNQVDTLSSQCSGVRAAIHNDPDGEK